VTTVRTLRVRLVGTGAALGLAAVLAGCGSGSSTAPTSPSGAGTAAVARPTGSGQRTGGRLDPAMQAKIQQCLEAAGIAVPTFARPSNLPSGRRPSFASGSPRPSGGFGGRFENPKVRAALQACGISLPTRSPGTGRAGGAAGPTSGPTS
jgi:hypothetical protein